MARKIKNLINSSKVDMGGILLDQPLPNGQLEMVDPFLLIHHWKDELPGSQDPMRVGVGPHPHRGFSPVTLIFNGEVHHRDSQGNDNIVSAGGTQWMFSGRGIVHSERPSKKLAENGGTFEIIQFWVNIAAKDKMGEPKYQSIQKDDTPIISSEDKKVNTAVVCGEHGGVSGPAQHPSDLLVLRIDAQSSGETEIAINKEFNSLIYVLDGEVEVDSEMALSDKQMAVFEQSQDSVKLKFKKDTRLIVLAGAPLDEPVVSYGPFVMNDQTQVMQALRDAQMGKMGVLIE
ncbi:MAG: pirin family protein [Bacteroidia bacterium]|nr:pirin family protein [Bacteroidia bacterium]